jgi:hypothetical protein
MIEGLGARVHLFVRPAFRERFIALFRDALQCDVRELDFGMLTRCCWFAFLTEARSASNSRILQPSRPSRSTMRSHFEVRGSSFARVTSAACTIASMKPVSPVFHTRAARIGTFARPAVRCSGSWTSATSAHKPPRRDAELRVGRVRRAVSRPRADDSSCHFTTKGVDAMPRGSGIPVMVENGVDWPFL